MGFLIGGAVSGLFGRPQKVGGQIASWYWSGTEYANNPDNAWNFNMNNGNQNINNKSNNNYGLAVRSG